MTTLSDPIREIAHAQRSFTGEPLVSSPCTWKLEPVSSAVGLGVATIQRLVRKGNFPKPRQLSGQRVAWLVREVEECIAIRVSTYMSRRHVVA